MEYLSKNVFRQQWEKVLRTEIYGTYCRSGSHSAVTHEEIEKSERKCGKFMINAEIREFENDIINYVNACESIPVDG